MVLVDITAQITEMSLDRPIKFTVVSSDRQQLLREEKGATVTAGWFIGIMFGHLDGSVPMMSSNS